MPNLFKITAQNQNSEKYTKGEVSSVIYHNIFDFPLNISEMIRWRTNDDLDISVNLQIINKNGYFFLEGREGLVYKRTLKKRISDRKIKIAQKAAKVLAFNPFVKMVAVTGSLAMDNSSEGSDIDLMVITSAGRLWTTRFFSYFLIKLFGFPVRKTNDKNQKDKLCLNIWMDESDLIWRKNRNIYTAHEIAQTVPLFNKNKTHEKFLSLNKWMLKFWPNAVRISTENRVGSRQREKTSLLNAFYHILGFVEKLAYRYQYQHMKSKITRETVTPTRALFHPQDWSSVVISRISS